MKIIKQMSHIKNLSELKNKYSFVRRDDFIKGGSQSCVFLIDGFAGKILSNNLKLGSSLYSANKIIYE